MKSVALWVLELRIAGCLKGQIAIAIGGSIGEPIEFQGIVFGCDYITGLHLTKPPKVLACCRWPVRNALITAHSRSQNVYLYHRWLLLIFHSVEDWSLFYSCFLSLLLCYDSDY